LSISAELPFQAGTNSSSESSSEDDDDVDEDDNDEEEAVNQYKLLENDLSLHFSLR
jgi:hypothetical protein